MALSCAGIVFSMFACLLDLCGTMNRCLKLVKDYSVGNVLSGKTFDLDYMYMLYSSVFRFVEHSNK